MSPWSKATVLGGEISSAHFGWLAGRCDRPRCPGTSARRHSLRNETKVQALRLGPAPRKPRALDHLLRALLGVCATPTKFFKAAGHMPARYHPADGGAAAPHKPSTRGRPFICGRTTCPCRESLSRCLEPKRGEAGSNRTGDPARPKRNRGVSNQNGPTRQGTQRLQEGHEGKDGASKARIACRAHDYAPKKGCILLATMRRRDRRRQSHYQRAERADVRGRAHGATARCKARPNTHSAKRRLWRAPCRGRLRARAAGPSGGGLPLQQSVGAA